MQQHPPAHSAHLENSATIDWACRVADVRKHFGRDDATVHALRGVDLDVRRGEFLAIMGQSGSGKSTLMHLMAGLDVASAGRVELGGVDITALGDEQLTLLRRRRVGFVFQAFNLVPTLDVADNIRLPFDLDGRRPRIEEREWIERLVSTLGLADRLSHRPHELSGGQQQRVAIARALATRPDVVFADEPTGNLDSRTGREVLALLSTVSSTHRQSIVMVTHDALAASHADRVVVLADGLIAHELTRPSAAQLADLMLGIEVAA